MFELRDGWGELQIQAYNRSLCQHAAARIREFLTLPELAPTSMLGSIASMPFPGQPTGDLADATRLHKALWRQHRIQVPVFPWKGNLYLRISAQIYNTEADYDRLIEVLSS